MITSIIEVFTLCGFIFGAACKLPPSLTILMMNGCFWFPIVRYFIYNHVKMLNCFTHCNQGYRSIKNEDSSKHTVTVLEVLGLLMQLGALVSIPVLLSIDHFYLPSGKASHYITATYILIPVSLCIISILWSGWIQKLIVRPSTNNKSPQQLSSNDKTELERTSDDDETARLKTGSYIHT